MVGGTPKANFCDTNGGFCGWVNWSAKSECSKDSDCPTPSMPALCCTELKAEFEKLCDNIDAAKLNEYITQQSGCTEAACSTPSVSPDISGNRIGICVDAYTINRL